MTRFAKHLSAAFLIVAGCEAVWAQAPPTPPARRSWRVAMTQRATIKSAGEIRAEGVVMNLETFSALCLEPSTSATFQVLGPETRAMTKSSRSNHLVIHELKPALKENPNKEPFFTRAEGAISAFTWIDGSFTNPLLSGEVNTDGGPSGKGSFSRQGLMARWDQGNNFYWFYIDYSNGTFAIMRSRFFGVMENLADDGGKNTWPVPNFKNTQSYLLEFELKGDTMKGRIYAQTAAGAKSTLVTETPLLRDKEPFAAGISGFLTEASINKPFEPLHGSFGTLSSTEQ